jgi:PAS domain S-box-containing protein
VIKTKEAFENAQRMAAIVEHSDDAIIAKTLEGRIMSWNQASEQMFGFSGLEIIGRSVYLLIPEDRVAETRTMMARLAAGGSVEHFETARVRKDGTRIAVSISESPIRDEDGMVVGVSTIARDVTERRNAFKEARAMIESSQDSLVAINPDGMISDANEATVKFTGVSRDELIGTPFSSYFTDPDKANRIYQLVFDQGTAVDYPLTIRHRDGTLTDVLYNASVHRDARETVLGVFAAARDVTHQRRVQGELADQLAAGLKHLTELEIFERLTVGHELQMIELNKEIEYLRGLITSDGAEARGR